MWYVLWFGSGVGREILPASKISIVVRSGQFERATLA